MYLLRYKMQACRAASTAATQLTLTLTRECGDGGGGGGGAAADGGGGGRMV